MKRRVLVVGGSDQGRLVIDILEAAGIHQIVGVVDGGLRLGSEVMGHPVVASDDAIAEAVQRTDADGFVVAIGDNAAHGEVSGRVHEACDHLEPITAVHPAAVIAKDAVIGAGSVLMAGVIVGNGCVIGEGAFLATNSSIDHDSRTGDFVSLAPGVATGGTLRIGAFTAIGVGASIIHGISIGDHSVIGAGAAVVEDVPDHVVVHGVPARVVRSRDAGEPYL